MHAGWAAIDNVRLGDERVLLIESQELLRDIDIGVLLRADLSEQIHSAAKFLVEDGARKVVSALRIAIQKESAAELVLRLIDRDVRTRRVDVPDEQRRRRQSGHPAANDMRLHLPLPRARARPRQTAPVAALKTRRPRNRIPPLLRGARGREQ